MHSAIKNIIYKGLEKVSKQLNIHPITLDWTSLLALRPVSEFEGNVRPDWSVNHGGIVDRREMAVHQVKLEFPQEHRPNCLYLDVRKVLSDTPMTPWKLKKEVSL